MRDLEKIQKLKPAISNEPSKWHEKAEFRRSNKRRLEYSAEVAMIVLNELERQGLNQSDLARIMDVTPQLVSRLVKGGENLTLGTVAQLEEALNINFLNLQVRRPDEEEDFDSKPTFSIRTKYYFPYKEAISQFMQDHIDFFNIVRCDEEATVSESETGISTLFKIDFSVESEELLCYD